MLDKKQDEKNTRRERKRKKKQKKSTDEEWTFKKTEKSKLQKMVSDGSQIIETVNLNAGIGR
jgi:CTP-dependent riboflavin kinase